MLRRGGGPLPRGDARHGRTTGVRAAAVAAAAAGPAVPDTAGRRCADGSTCWRGYGPRRADLYLSVVQSAGGKGIARQERRDLEFPPFGGHPRYLGKRRMSSAQASPGLSSEQMVELVRAGRTPEELSQEFEPSSQAIRNWVRQAIATWSIEPTGSRAPSARSCDACGERTACARSADSVKSRHLVRSGGRFEVGGLGFVSLTRISFAIAPCASSWASPPAGRVAPPSLGALGDAADGRSARSTPVARHLWGPAHGGS